MGPRVYRPYPGRLDFRCVRLYEYVRISRQGFVTEYQGIIGCVCLCVKSWRNVVQKDMVIRKTRISFV